MRGAVIDNSGDKPPLRRQLSPNYLSGFARDYWEKNPVLIKRAFVRPLLSPSELFNATLRASSRFRNGDESARTRFYIEHAQQIPDIGNYLPRASDRTLRGYAARISRQLKGRRFALIIENLQVHSIDLWTRLREFLHALSHEVELPSDHTKATLFLGNYDCTPAGLHRGDSGNFKFVLAGRKRMVLWPDKFLSRQKNATHRTDYARFRSAATILEGRPGDLIYWPSDFWHVGETIGGLAASLSLALFVKSRPRLWRDLMEETFTAVEEISPNGYRTAAQIARMAVREFKKASQSRTVKECVVASALIRETSMGFAMSPPPSSQERLSILSVVRADPRFPIRWSRLDHREIVCSANGRAFALPAEPSIASLLKRLNTGEPLPIRELANRDYVRPLLEKLLSLRAISFVRPAKPRRSLHRNRRGSRRLRTSP